MSRRNTTERSDASVLDFAPKPTGDQGGRDGTGPRRHVDAPRGRGSGFEPMPGRLQELLADGKTAFGVWVMLSGPSGAEMIASVGPDYLGIDCQHGLLA